MAKMSSTAASPASGPVMTFSTRAAAATATIPSSNTVIADENAVQPTLFEAKGRSIASCNASKSKELAGPLEDKPSALALDTEQESELSDPDSSIQTPPRIFEISDEIVAQSGGVTSTSPTAQGPFGLEEENSTDADEPFIPHYRTRNRISIFSNINSTKMEVSNPSQAENGTQPGNFKAKVHCGIRGVKGVLIGHWRDSQVPNLDGKHAVTAFLDARDRLRTRIQLLTKDGRIIPSSQYPLPSGPGGSWVTFNRIFFLDHLIGLNQFQIKEYVKLRTNVVEETDEERIAAEKEAVSLAAIKGRQLLQTENPVTPPLVAYGQTSTSMQTLSSERAPKRQRTSESFTSSPQDDVSHAHQEPTALDLLHGTRPAKIILGYWRGSSESNPVNRHAVYGILGQNDMFRVKVVRETRDGRFVNGNFPAGVGALWLHFSDVELESHLKMLSRLEIKQYCRIRQFQIDRGETINERKSNELRAASHARATAYLSRHYHTDASNTTYKFHTTSNPVGGSNAAEPQGHATNGYLADAYNLRRLRTFERSLTAQNSLTEAPTGTVALAAGTSGIHGLHNAEAIERTKALARREIARVEAAQSRVELHAIQSQRAAQAASGALAHASPVTQRRSAAHSKPSSPRLADGDCAETEAASSKSKSNGNGNGNDKENGSGSNHGGCMPLHQSEEMERLNRVWARQESQRFQSEPENTKMYAGVKYERKATGPLMGKLVSQGSIITIDGEDYVEYRVLTKPSFF